MRILPLDEIFYAKGKIIIGVVHLQPLPGSPLYSGDLDLVMERAIRDAKTLEAGGVDGIIVENMGDKPFLPDKIAPETISALTLIAKEVIKNISIPVGINVLRNAAIEAAAIAHIVGGKFIRVNAYIEPIATDSGIIQPIAPRLLRYMRWLNSELGILADIAVKHASSLYRANIEDIAYDAFTRGLASAIVVTGRRTGTPPNIEVLQCLKQLNIGPILIGSGLRVDNIELLEYADGAIVGTFFKKKSEVGAPVDLEKVKKLIGVVREKFRT